MRRAVLIVLMLVPVALPASQLVTVIEDFTATWCTYCPGAARGIEELQFRAFDSVVAIAYHSSSSDPFYTATAAARMSYYGVSGYPTVILDGDSTVVGGIHSGTMFPIYWDYWRSHAANPSPLDIDLSTTYDSVARSGVLTIVVRNTGSAPINGQLHTALTESHIAHYWQGMDSLHDVERTMLPSASGEAISVPVGDSVVRTRNFTISPSWVARNCRFIVFVQNNSSRAIHQGAWCDVVQRPTLEYYGFVGSPARPGGSVQLRPMLRNLGSATATGVTGSLSTTDPYVTVTTPGAAYPDIGVAGTLGPNTPFALTIATNCPSDRVVTLTLDVSSGGRFTIPMLVTAGTGFSDDCESGVGGWVRTGINCQWALSTVRSHSPTRSWTTTSSGQYPNQTDMRLTSPRFLVGDGATLEFWQWYAVEQGWDYCMVDVSPGGPFWHTLGTWTGAARNWARQSFSLTEFAGATMQVRFRFLSDGSVTDDGWSVDDIVVSPHASAVAEPPADLRLGVGAAHSVTAGPVALSYSLPPGARGRLTAYDAAGRMVRTVASSLVGAGTVEWRLDSNSGGQVAAGAYVMRLESDRGVVADKVFVVR